MANPRLTVEITASEAKFREDLGKAVKHAEKASKDIGIAMSGVKGLITGALSGLSIAAFVGLIKGTIDAADKLHDLAQTTGVAVETLGGIGFAAKQAGTDLEGVAKAFGKFNLEIAKGAGGDADVARTFELIGISVKELRDSKPDEILAKVADKFASFADGPQKAALANEFFKKGYQELIPLLNDGGAALRANIAYFQKYSGINEELTRKADAFNDEMEKAKLLTGAFGNALAAKLLPSLQGLVELFVEAKEEGDGFNNTAGNLVDGMKNIAKGTALVVRELIGFTDFLGGLAAMAVSLAKLDFKGIAAIDAAMVQRQKDFSKDIDRVFDALDGKNLKGGIAAPRPNRRAPSLPGKDAAGNTAKDVLDQQLKALDRSIKDEQDILKDREHFLQGYYQDDQIGIKDYFDRRQAVISEAVQKQIALYDQERTALELFKSGKGRTEKERIDTDTKIAEVVAKRADLEHDAAIKSIDLWLEQKKAAKEFQSQVEDIAIAIKQMSGDTVGAGLAGFDKANEQFLQRARLRAGSSDASESAAGQKALAQFYSLRNLTEQQLRMNKAQGDFRGILEDVGIANQKINNLQASGAITTLDAMNQRSALAKANIGLLEKELAAYEALANSPLTTGDAKIDALRNAQRLRLEIDQLALSAEELEITFRKTFEDALTNSLTDAITGTKSLKEAFRDMEKSIVASISRIASQNIAESIFGKSGPAGGAAGGLAALFSGAGGGVHGGAFGDAFIKLFGFAGGGPVAANEPIWVGEKGKEVFVPRSAGNIIPNHKLGSGRGLVVNNYNTIMPGASRETADQAAMRMGVRSQRAMARNG